MHVYEVRPRNDNRRVDLISDALPFCRLSYGEPDPVSDAIGHAQLRHMDDRNSESVIMNTKKLMSDTATYAIAVQAKAAIQRGRRS